MNEESNEQAKPLEECAAQLSSAAKALEQVIGKLEAQYEALNQKIDRIIAVVEKHPERAEEKVSAAAERRGGRRTLVSRLLAKSGLNEGVQIDPETLERALGGLTIEQRIAVKGELARAGAIG
jgi:hypothetical protein